MSFASVCGACVRRAPLPRQLMNCEAGATTDGLQAAHRAVRSISAGPPTTTYTRDFNAFVVIGRSRRATASFLALTRR